MENMNVEKAIEDVEFIKGIMQRAADSLNGFSKVLLWWGSAWLALVIMLLILSSPLVAVTPQVGHAVQNSVYVTGFILLLSVFAVIIVGGGFGLSTYRTAMKSPVISSLTRSLLSIWGFVSLISLCFPLLYAFFYCLSRIEVLLPEIMKMNLGVTVAATNLFAESGLFSAYAHAMDVWLFALAFTITASLTRLPVVKWFAGIFITVAVLYPLCGDMISGYFYPGPMAMIMMGIYLEIRRRKEGV